jgi:hypothetical protein
MSAPLQGQEQARLRKAANRAYAQLRSPGERANAQRKTWHILRKLPMLVLAGRATGQSHPCPSGPRDRRMKKAHCAASPNTKVKLVRRWPRTGSSVPGVAPACEHGRFKIVKLGRVAAGMR